MPQTMDSRSSSNFFSFWPESQYLEQQISKEFSGTWIGTWPQISFQPADLELILILLKYELTSVEQIVVYGLRMMLKAQQRNIAVSINKLVL